MKKEAKETKEKSALLEMLAKELPLYKDKDYETKVEPSPSGSISLDMAIGIGGYPRGSIVDIYGPSSAGKSLISIMAIAEIQKMGGTAVVWDAERSYSKNMEWMRINGVDTSKLMFLKLGPDQGAEIGFSAIEKICKSNSADLIVIDSIPSLIPQSALEKDMTENDRLGARASLLTNALPRLASICDESKTIVMMINQMRSNIGASLYQPTEKETSIFALKHFATLRLAVKKINKSVKIENDIPVSHRVNITVVKNKVSAPGKQAEFEINYTKGIDNLSEITDILINSGIAKATGAWIEYKGEKMHGWKGLYEFLKNPKEKEIALKKIKETNINVFGVNKENKDDIVEIDD